MPGRIDEVREREDDWRDVCGRVRDACGLAAAGEDRLRRSALPLFNRMCGGPLRSGGEESMVRVGGRVEGAERVGGREWWWWWRLPGVDAVNQ